MRVLFMMRASARSKPGGDLVQAERYAAELARRGHTVHLALGLNPLNFRPYTLPVPPSSFPLLPWDVVHLFNVDRPWEALEYLLRAGDDGSAKILSLIHHPSECVEGQGRVHGFRVERWLYRLGLPFSVVEQIKEAARALAERRWIGLAVATVPLRVAQRMLIRRCHGIQVLSPWEVDRLKRALGSSVFEGQALRVVRNGATIPGSAGASLPPEVEAFASTYPRFACVVGRIEPRKNQLGIIQSLKAGAVPILFIGAINENHPDYAREFRQQVSADARLLYLGPMPAASVHAILRRAHVHVSASFCEVMSLVDLEALQCGCHVVSSKCGYSPEYAGSEFLYCDPWTPATIRAAVETALSAPARREAPTQSALGFTWEQAGDGLLELYREALERVQPHVV